MAPVSLLCILHKAAFRSTFGALDGTIKSKEGSALSHCNRCTNSQAENSKRELSDFKLMRGQSMSVVFPPTDYFAWIFIHAKFTREWEVPVSE